MWNYLFEIVSEYSELCGERVFVQCDTKEEAEEIMAQDFWGEKVAYLGKYTDDEAEMMGYDTF